MSADVLMTRLREITRASCPVPGAGQTAERHQHLFAIGRENLSLARLAEAHLDAISILVEAGRDPVADALYGVWASEIPGSALQLQVSGNDRLVSGTKMFCSGARMVDRALVTVGAPVPLLFDIDLRKNASHLSYDGSSWKTHAFAATNTSAVTFSYVPVFVSDQVGPPAWYLDRPGFWHGACGPAACWAGGAAGLVDYAMAGKRSDPHTLAHVGAMRSAVWMMQSCLAQAAREIDAAPQNVPAARIRARTVRHLVEQACTDVLRRLARAYGPHPLAMDEEVSRRYAELDLYLRQSHAERDLEALGLDLLAKS